MMQKNNLHWNEAVLMTVHQDAGEPVVKSTAFLVCGFGQVI